MQKLIAEESQKREKLSGHLVAILVVAVVLLSVVRVVLANWLVESSETLRSLDNKIAQQTRENQALSEQWREKSSLATVESQAKASGFVPTVKLTFIETFRNVAASSPVPSTMR